MRQDFSAQSDPTLITSTGKRLVLTSLGSFGDVHPFISVALALKARGFNPVIAASEGYRQKVMSEGLPFFSVTPTPDEVLNDNRLTDRQIIQNLGAGFIIDKSVTPYIERSYRDLCNAMEGASAVVACNFSMVARIAAEKLGLPVISLVLSPCMFFSADEPAHLLQAPWLSGFHKIFGTSGARFLLNLRRAKSRWHTRSLTRFRQRLGLKVPKGDEFLDGLMRAERIYGLYSPLLGSLPADAPRNSVVAGHTFYDSHQGGQLALSTELAAFLAEGPAPLVFTLGSVAVNAPGTFYEVAAAAARRLAMRAVLMVGSKAHSSWAHLSSDDIFVAAYAPHSLIFPRAAAIIHHGGIGTVGQALRAGRVQLVCPMVGDQADNAERLVRLGVAKRLDHCRATADRMATALKALLGDKIAVSRAAALGIEIASEDGASVVSDGIAALLSTRHD